MLGRLASDNKSCTVIPSSVSASEIAALFGAKTVYAADGLDKVPAESGV